MGDEQVIWHQYSSGPPDKYGKPTSVFEDREIFAMVAPGQSSEPRNGTTTRTIAEMTIYADVIPDPRDEFTIRGKRYEVEVDTEMWRNPLTGSAFGTEIALRKVRG